MKTTKKKPTVRFIAIVTVVAVSLSAVCIGDKTPPPVSMPTTESGGTLKCFRTIGKSCV